jgi:hypothetical protein
VQAGRLNPINTGFSGIIRHPLGNSRDAYTFFETSKPEFGRQLQLAKYSQRRISFGRITEIVITQQQYRTSDCKCTFINLEHRAEAPCGQPIDKDY